MGVILFQEQVLKVARDLAGFTPGEGELLRRALSHKQADQQIESFRAKFIAGAQSKGVSPEDRRTGLQSTQSLWRLFIFKGPRGGLRRHHLLVGLAALLSSRRPSSRDCCAINRWASIPSMS